MRIAYASDLHLEFNTPVTMTGLSAADVLVLAGDVDTMPEYYTEFLRKLRLAYAGPVIFVLGNHEYYNGIFPDDRQKYREAIAHDRQAFLLENESVVIQGVRFLGATLWTDFAGGKQMRNCQRMMSDFDVIFDGVSTLQGHSGSITCVFRPHPATDSTVIRPPLGRGRRWVVLFIMTSFAEQGGFCGATIHAQDSRSIAIEVRGGTVRQGDRP